jgi:MFS family permease
VTTTAWTTPVDEAALATLRAPRDDIVRERAVAPDRFTLDHGPFCSYERALDVQPLVDGRHEVTQRVTFELAPGAWPFLIGPLYRRAFRNGTRRPWWAPPQRFDAESATALGLLAVASLVLGYVATLASQTITFAADEFGAGDRAQGDTLAVVRAGVLLAVVLTSLADRHGRRRLLVISASIAIVATMAGAFAPNLASLGATQLVARGATSALAIVIAITAAEEVPAGSRAYAVSLLAVTGALGAGMCLWVLPLADLGERWWRVLYILPVAGAPVIAWVGRRLPESRRYRVPHAEVGMTGHGRRFWMLAGSAFLLAVFTSPASLFQNEYLRDDRGYSAAAITLFTILTNTPGGIGIVVGGRLADVRGRRIVGAVGVLGGTLATVVMYSTTGATMWLASVIGAVVGAAVVPALGVYGPELFPTSLRGRANGIITTLGVAGSVLGLVVVGRLAEGFDGFGPALTVMAVGPLLMAGLVLAVYPETAHRELEELNPEDRADRPPACGTAEVQK